jgi:hypothetical protein
VLDDLVKRTAEHAGGQGRSAEVDGAEQLGDGAVISSDLGMHSIVGDCNCTSGEACTVDMSHNCLCLLKIHFASVLQGRVQRGEVVLII